MKSHPCLVCDGSDYQRYLTEVYSLNERSFDLIRCRSCGMVRIEPPPETEEVRALYNAAYFNQDFSCGVRKGTYLESEAMRVEEYREILNLIRPYRPAGKLLEVGCAAGSFLNYARRSGYEVAGVDVSEWAARTAAEQFGLQVRVGRLFEAGYPEASFDVAFLGDLLEHEPDPLGLLLEIKRVLKPHGLVAIKAPTYVNSFYFRVARRIPGSWLMGRLDLRLLQAMKLAHQRPAPPPYHLYEFNRATLTRLLEKAGLSVVQHRTSLLVPEFLDSWKASPFDRFVYYGFKLLKSVVVTLNLPAGHVLILAEKG